MSALRVSAFGFVAPIWFLLSTFSLSRVSLKKEVSSWRQALLEGAGDLVSWI